MKGREKDLASDMQIFLDFVESYDKKKTATNFNAFIDDVKSNLKSFIVRASCEASVNHQLSTISERVSDLSKVLYAPLQGCDPKEPTSKRSNEASTSTAVVPSSNITNSWNYCKFKILREESPNPNNKRSVESIKKTINTTFKKANTGVQCIRLYENNTLEDGTIEYRMDCFPADKASFITANFNIWCSAINMKLKPKKTKVVIHGLPIISNSSDINEDLTIIQDECKLQQLPVEAVTWITKDRQNKKHGSAIVTIDASNFEDSQRIQTNLNNGRILLFNRSCKIVNYMYRPFACFHCKGKHHINNCPNRATTTSSSPSKSRKQCSKNFLKNLGDLFDD